MWPSCGLNLRSPWIVSTCVGSWTPRYRRLTFFFLSLAEAQHAQMANEQLASKPHIPPWRYPSAHKSDSDQHCQPSGAAEFRVRSRETPVWKRGKKTHSD